MHQDVLERIWLVILTKDTKNQKIDGVLKVLKMRKKEHQTICIVEFSYDSVSCKKACVYTIQCVIYLYEEFVCIKIPTSFDDIEQFAMNMKMLMDFQSDVLKTFKSVNKPVKIENVDKSVVEIMPKKSTKKANKKST
ncbi:18162_t:CDS:2 [Funneliformis geosporum]|nr:18162_t:CDS:2 [Funneliformis geosporum]